VEIRRNENKNRISKLTAELMFFRLLYLSWVHRDAGSSALVTLREIGLFTDVSLRTLTRYARELRDCGAVQGLRFNTTEKAFVGQFLKRTQPVSQTTSCADAHIHRLARTTLLMTRWLDSGKQVDLDESSHRIKFFNSKEDMEEWYNEHFPHNWLSHRTMQRDMQAVRDALRENEMIEQNNLYGKGWGIR
jgi:hypothetical protein